MTVTSCPWTVVLDGNGALFYTYFWDKYLGKLTGASYAPELPTTSISSSPSLESQMIAGLNIVGDKDKIKCLGEDRTQETRG